MNKLKKLSNKETNLKIMNNTEEYMINLTPTETVKNKNWILSVIYTSCIFSYTQSKEIVKKTGITTLPQLLTFFSKDTEYIHKALSIPRVTVNKIDDFKKMLNGEILL